MTTEQRKIFNCKKSEARAAFGAFLNGMTAVERVSTYTNKPAEKRLSLPKGIVSSAAAIARAIQKFPGLVNAEKETESLAVLRAFCERTCDENTNPKTKDELAGITISRDELNAIAHLASVTRKRAGTLATELKGEMLKVLDGITAEVLA